MTRGSSALPLPRISRRSDLGAGRALVHDGGDLDAVDEEVGVDLQDVADLGAVTDDGARTTPFGSAAPAARQVQLPSSRALVSSMSILRGMAAKGTRGS